MAVLFEPWGPDKTPASLAEVMERDGITDWSVLMTERQRLARDLKLSIWANWRKSKNPQRQAEAALAFRVAQFLDAEQDAIDRYVGRLFLSETGQDQ